MAVKRRVYQISERIREILAEHIIRTADPRLNLVTITSVVVTPDLRIAKIYWVCTVPSGIDRDDRLNDAQEALEGAEGLFKRFLGKELGVRHVPGLKFFYDNTLDTVEEVERLMARVNSTSKE